MGQRIGGKGGSERGREVRTTERMRKGKMKVGWKRERDKG